MPVDDLHVIKVDSLQFEELNHKGEIVVREIHVGGLYFGIKVIGIIEENCGHVGSFSYYIVLHGTANDFRVFRPIKVEYQCQN